MFVSKQAMLSYVHGAGGREDETHGTAMQLLPPQSTTRVAARSHHLSIESGVLLLGQRLEVEANATVGSPGIELPRVPHSKRLCIPVYLLIARSADTAALALPPHGRW